VRSQRVVMAIVFGVLTAACSGPVEDVTGDEGSSTSAPVGSGGLSAAGVVAWLREPITGGSVGASELSAELAEHLPGFTASSPPERFILGTLESWEWMVSCGAANGEAMEIIGDPPNLRWQTNPRTARVFDACSEAAFAMGWGMASPFDGSPASNRLLYFLWLEVYECLRDNGYPTVDPPSEDAFIERGAPLWNPYSGMTGLPVGVADRSFASPREREQLAAQELCGTFGETMLQQQASDNP
jgi:hypothetical protein